MLQAMIDIETLDTKPTAIVFQIGLVVWDIDKYAEYLFELSVQDQIDKGRTLSADTLGFWTNPKISSIAHESLRTTLQDNTKYQLDAFVSAIKDCKQVWSKTFFDFEILENLLPHYRHNVPWHNGRRRDLLTLMEECGVEKPLEGNSHHALEDCQQQLEQLSQCREIIAGRLV